MIYFYFLSEKFKNVVQEIIIIIMEKKHLYISNLSSKRKDYEQLKIIMTHILGLEQNDLFIREDVVRKYNINSY